ncbi:histidine phosphatase family protein [Flaviflagellibacter deserti]|uniref:Histidine phosphatase family protein n=1 Tax=Flaviflagellibacter deserti TaxID=2267266 RepID=A0ABV9Z0M8_9HYPH
MRIFWVRHGVHDQLGWKLSGRTAGVVLGDPGLCQAREVGARLKKEAIEIVFTSPLERSQQTAQPIAELCGAELCLEPAINEIDFGEWNGREIADLDRNARFVRWNVGRDQASAAGGESMFDVQARVFRWMESIVDSGRRNVAAVSHSDVIKAAVMVALGLSPRAHDRLEISPGSITCIAGSELGYRLMSLNEMPA